MPLRQFVALNRFVIKITHFPLLFCIYAYEKYFLAPSMYDPTDLVEHPGRGRQRAISLADPASRTALFSPNVRVREGSVVGFQKDRALEEVFRRAPDLATLRTKRRHERRKTQNAIRTWMDQHEGEYGNSPQNYSTMDSRSVNEWQRRLSVNRDNRPRRFRHFSDARSAASDPADLMSNAAYPMAPDFYNHGISRRDHAVEVSHNTDADGDDEFVTNDEFEEDNATNAPENSRPREATIEEEETPTTPTAAQFGNLASSSLGSTGPQLQRTPGSPQAGPSRRRGMHNRTMSTNTILYAPQESSRSPRSSSSTSIDQPMTTTTPRPLSKRHVPADASPAGGGGRRSPRRSVYMSSRPPILPTRDVARAAFNRSAMLSLDIPGRQAAARRRSSVDQDPSSELNAAMAADDTLGAVPSSFATQMAMAMTPLGLAKSAGAADRESSNRMSRLMLAKMKTLEESIGDVVREMRVLRSAGVSTAHNSGDDDGGAGAGGAGGRRKAPHYRVGSGSTEGSAGPAVVEVAAARERRGPLRRANTATARIGGGRRPLSRLSLEEEKVGMGHGEVSGKSKGKGKAVEIADVDDDGDDSAGLDEEDTSFTRRGSSF